MPAISDRVYRVEAPYSGNAVHLYLVRGAKLALIDSGYSASPAEAVEPALRELGLSWSDLDYLLNTHGHPDHAGGNSAVEGLAPQAEIGIHRDDAHLAGGPPAHLRSPSDGGVLLPLLGREDLIPEREAVLRQLVGGEFGVDRELVDGDVVDLGRDIRLQVVHTPGHTAGSVCYFWEAEGFVFSGDAVQGHGWRSGIGPRYGDAVYLSSLDRIAELNASTLCMGHTFGWSGIHNDPVRRGPEIARTLESSRRAAAVIDRAAGLALETLGPEAPFPQLAEAAFREIVYDLPISFDRRTVVPPAFATAIHAHLLERGWRAPG